MMKTKVEVKVQITAAYLELDRIGRMEPPGFGTWRMQRKYIDALEWVINDEGS